MKLNMKCALLCVCISLFTLQVQAQPASGGEPEKKKELPREVPNPEKNSPAGNRQAEGCLEIER